MSNCRKCGVELTIGDNWLPSMKKYGNYSCKPCHHSKTKKHYYSNPERAKQQVKQHYNKTKHDFVVYLLEDDNYVGVTQNINYRKAVHKHLNRNIDKLRILYSTKKRSDALELEELLHTMGYEGKHNKNLYR